MLFALVKTSDSTLIYVVTKQKQMLTQRVSQQSYFLKITDSFHTFQPMLFSLIQVKEKCKVQRHKTGLLFIFPSPFLCP